MRVRDLQYLIDRCQVDIEEPVESIKNTKIGVDAIHWLRCIPALKDPLSDIFGGISANVPQTLSTELNFFHMIGVKPVFVFNGMDFDVSSAARDMFANYSDGWRHWSEGQSPKAMTTFALAASRINSDFVHFVFHYLVSLGYDCLVAPYQVDAQLASMLKNGDVNYIHAGPFPLLFEAPAVITLFRKKSSTGALVYRITNRKKLLDQLQISGPTLLEACLLAGTDTTSAFPQLRLPPYTNPQRPTPLIEFALRMLTRHNLNMLEAVALARYECSRHPDIVKQIDEWLPPVLALRAQVLNAHVLAVSGVSLSGDSTLQVVDVVPLKPEGYIDLAKQLNPSAANLTPQQILANVSALPKGSEAVLGVRLPLELYLFASRGIIDREVLASLAKGVWADQEDLRVPEDTHQLREVLDDEVRAMRLRTAELLLAHLSPKADLRGRKIVFRSAVAASSTANPELESRVSLEVGSPPSLGLRFSSEDVSKFLGQEPVGERIYQGFPSLGQALRFSKWLRAQPPSTAPSDAPPMNAAHLMMRHQLLLLEHLNYLSPDAPVMLAQAVEDVPIEQLAPVLALLEIFKAGLLSTSLNRAAPRELLDLVTQGSVKPPAVPSLRVANSSEAPLDESPAQRALRLLVRMTSLSPLQSKPPRIEPPQCVMTSPEGLREVRSLAGWLAIVKTLLRSMRQLSQACLAHILIEAPAAAELLPQNFMHPCPAHEQPPGVLFRQTPCPSFVLPRGYLGLMVNEVVHVMRTKADLDVAGLKAHLETGFPLALDPLADVKQGFALAAQMLRVLGRVTPLDETLQADLRGLRKILAEVFARWPSSFSIPLPQAFSN